MQSEEKSKHVVYNDKTKQFHILHEFEHHFGYHRLVNVKDKQLLLLGGSGRDNRLDCIYEYEFKEKAWNLSAVSIPIKLILPD